MANYLKRVLSATAAAALAATLAACGGGDEESTGNNAGGDETTSTDESAAGGTLYYLQHYPFESLDPQRAYYGLELANLRRTMYRSLVAFPVTEDPEVGATPVADLATDTGTSLEGGKVWQFTLKDGVKWEDGSDITCEDFKYGASRVFASDVITGGPTYLTTYLDIPEDAKGQPVYKGPYSGEGQAEFDKAITCDGKTITYRFKTPWVDFPLAVAGLSMMDPYKQSFDEGAKSTWKVLSNGPYRIEGNRWDKNKGATLVRNENYDPATDTTELRAALPDTIEYQIDPADTSIELIIDRVIADSGNDQFAVAAPNVPPSHYSQIVGPVEERSVKTDSPYVFYLLPNMKSPEMQDVRVRQALALATNVDAVVKARGGENAAAPAESIVSPTLPGYADNPAFAGDNAGDPEAAAALLEEAGVTTPLEITFTYATSATNDQIAAVLKEGWDAAGFDTKLEPLSDTYYDVIGKPEKESDVMMAGWGADWPSAMTVTAALFDSRPNITATFCGNNYGCYESDEFNAIIDQAINAASVEEQNEYLAQADLKLGEDVAYIPLYGLKNFYVYGSKVANYTVTPSTSMYPDLGIIGVEQ